MDIDMVKLALSITQGARSVTEAARRIYSWVMGKWAYTWPSFQLFGDSDLTMSGRGIEDNMIELASWLSSASYDPHVIVGSLLRSAGIPTRFRFGTWVEFYDGENWIPASTHSGFGTLGKHFAETGNEELLSSGLSPSLDDPHVGEIREVMNTSRLTRLAGNTESIAVLTPSTLNEDEFQKALDTVMNSGYDAIILIIKDSFGDLYYNTSYGERFRGDVLGQVLKRAHQSNVKVYVGLNVLFDRTYVGEHPQSAQVGPEGVSREFVCPTDSTYVNFMKTLLDEILSGYSVDGVVLFSLYWTSEDFGKESSTVKAFESETGLSFENQTTSLRSSAFEDWKTNYIVNLTLEFKSLVDSEANIPVLYASSPENWNSIQYPVWERAMAPMEKIARVVDYLLIIYEWPQVGLLRETRNLIPNLIPSFPIVDEWPYPAEYYYYLKGYAWECGVHSVAFHLSIRDVNTYYRNSTVQILSRINNPGIVPFYTASFDSKPRVGTLIVDNVTLNSDRLPISLEWREGSTHSFEVRTLVQYVPDVRYVFDGWEDGSNLNKRVFVVSSDAAFVAEYRVEYFVSISSPYGNCSGAGWYENGEMANLSIPDIVDHHNGTRRTLDGWYKGGARVGSTEFLSLKVDAPTFLTIKWDTEYLVNATTPVSYVSGAAWYTAETNATVSVSTTQLEKDFFTNYVFEGWTVAGTIVSTSPSYSFAVIGPVSLTANWNTELNLVTTGAVAGVAILLIAAVVLLMSRRSKSSKANKPCTDCLTSS
jgi:uncharacterized repeat protein (TIGR02543 family)